jgi:hypothetical protein
MSEEPQNTQKNTWEISSVRFTFFFEEAHAPDLILLFKACCENDAESDSTDLQTNKRTVSGRHGEFQFSLTKTPERIDAAIAVNIQAVPLNEPLPFLLRIDQGEQMILGMFEKIVKAFPVHKRIALGVIYHKRFSSNDDSYIELSRLLPSIKIDVGASSELFYRINRPRTVEIGNIRYGINRISNWAAIVSMKYVIDPGVSAAEKNVPQTTSLAYAVRLETDINTFPAADLTKVEPEQKVALINCLYDFSTEIAQEGDIS